jgi:tRNA A37 threonylcarbamoyladenosine modification protein TsaB
VSTPGTAPAAGGPVLVIDTSGEGCAVAVVASGRLLAEIDAPMDRGHAERLMGMVGAALDRAGLLPAALGGIVVCTGPGGFTGVRVGVAAARGIALGLGVPAVGVDRFEALAAGSVGEATVALAVGGTILAQSFRDGRPLGPPEDSEGPPSPDRVTALQLAAVAAGGGGRVPAAPLYLRPPDALPSRHAPPPLLP